MENNSTINTTDLSANFIGSKAQETDAQEAFFYSHFAEMEQEYQQHLIAQDQQNNYDMISEQFDKDTARVIAEQRSKANKPKINDVKAVVQVWIEHGKPQRAWSMLKRSFGHKKFLPRHNDIIYKERFVLDGKMEEVDDGFGQTDLDFIISGDHKTETYRAKSVSRLRESMLYFLKSLQDHYEKSGNYEFSNYARFLVEKMTGGKDAYNMFQGKARKAVEQSNEKAADMKPSIMKKQRTYLNNIIQQNSGNHNGILARNRKHELRQVYAESPVLHQDRYVLLGGSCR